MAHKVSLVLTSCMPSSMLNSVIAQTLDLSRGIITICADFEQSICTLKLLSSPSSCPARTSSSGRVTRRWSVLTEEGHASSCEGSEEHTDADESTDTSSEEEQAQEDGDQGLLN